MGHALETTDGVGDGETESGAAGRLRSAFGRLLRSGPAQVVRSVAAEWREDRVGGLAAEVAFFAVLSVVPGLLAIIAGLGFADRIVGTELAQHAEATVVRFLRSVLTNRATTVIELVRDLFEQEQAALISFAMAGTVWAFSRGLLAVITALEIAYGLSPERWWKRRLKALGLAVGTTIILVLLLAVVIVGPLLGALRAVLIAANLHGLVGPVLWLRYPLALGLLVAWPWMIYHLGPNHRSPWRWDLPGALLTGLLWLLVSLGLRLYLAVAGDANQIFGVLGGALIAIIWLYLVSLALLTGGELNDVLLSARGRHRPLRDVPEPKG